MGHASPFQTFKFQKLSNDIRNFLIQWVLTPTIALWRFKSPLQLQLPKWEFIGECGVHSFTLSHIPKSMKCDFRASFLVRTFVCPCLGHEPKARVATPIILGQLNVILFSIYTMQYNVVLRYIPLDPNLYPKYFLRIKGFELLVSRDKTRKYVTNNNQPMPKQHVVHSNIVPYA